MIGKSLGRYAIESKLGEGGMGVVFKARDTQLERAVAIKVLPPGKVADPDRKRRFVQEAKAASALNHPHIITIYDVGSDGDTDFIVMEYLAGTTLDHLVPAPGLPLKRALAYAVAIADALAKAHEAGIIHRDLKPSNVMITDAGGVKVLDFGVAKLLEPVEASGDPQGRPDVLLVPAGGGKPKVLTANTRNGAFPTFSRDGQWIYFSSADAGKVGIWKIPVSGGDAIPVLQKTAAVIVESYDGRDLYYSETADRSSSVWRWPLTGGAPVKVLDGVVLGLFDVVERGIYYVDRASGETGGFFVDRSGGETRLQYYDFSTRKSSTVARNLGTVGLGLSASRDGRTIFYSRVDSAVDELMLVENFR